MKITLELDLDQEIDIRAGSKTVTWLLGMLPEDEARLAIQVWTYWERAGDQAERDAAEDRREEEQAGGDGDSSDRVELTETRFVVEAGVTPDLVPVVDLQPHMKSAEPEPDVSRETSGKPAAKPSYDNFTYAGKKFSTRKRGPSAAMKAAVADIMAADRRELEKLHSKLSGLKGIFLELDRYDLAGEIDTALGRRMAELPEAQTEPQTKPEPQAEPEEQAIKAGEVLEVPGHGQGVVLGEQPPTETVKVSLKPQRFGNMVEWDDQQVRPVLARALCLKKIANCATVEQLDQITDAADQLADLLQDMGQAPFANEIRTAVNARMDALVAQEDASEQAPAGTPAGTPAQERVGPPTPRRGASTNGAEEAEPLRQIMNRYVDQHNRDKARTLIKEHTGGKKTELDQLTENEAQAVREAALAGLAGTS